MPELPEAETVRRQLEPQLTGALITYAWARIPRRTVPSPEIFAAKLPGRRIVAARRRGKQLIFPLDDGESLFVHLGMTGRLAVEAQTSPFDPEQLHKHIHAVVGLEGERQLVFRDPRTFGQVGVLASLPLVNTMGPEPLDDDFDQPALVAKLHGKNMPIKSALLDQRLVAGLGSIYADEVCFEARVHPAARASSVSLAKLKTLVSLIRPVLERAIAARGATLKDGGYQDTFGEYGEFIPQAYGRTGEPCRVCATPIRRGVLGESGSGRSYHFCPHCQRLPRKSA